MKNKKIGAYSLVGVLLVAGSNLHGSEENFYGSVTKRLRKGWEYTKDNKSAVGFNVATLTSMVLTGWSVIYNRQLKNEMHDLTDAQAIRSQIQGIHSLKKALWLKDLKGGQKES